MLGVLRKYKAIIVDMVERVRKFVNGLVDL